MAASAMRARPEGGGIVWKAESHAFFCEGCEEYTEIRRRREYDDPEFVAEMTELLIIDHTECWKFSDPKMARDARRYRTEKTRRANLAAQRTSWKGRQEWLARK